jgi:LCP family protein required for cell wall assembly
MIAGRVGYAASCLLAAALLVASGYAYRVTTLVAGLESGISLSGGSSTGALNILLMGLESRTNYYGQTLSAQLLTAMHAGSVDGVNNQGVGGQDTNTLILIHIFAGGERAVGYSIPRDDWVTYPKPYDGQSQGKIDQAYGLAYAQSLSATVSSSMSSKQRYLLANDAGQGAEISTVESVTGQPVDHFAEVNLAGFYYLAQAFNGIEVCVRPWNGGANLEDYNSGFNAVKYDGYSRKKGGSQYLHLAADQALAFVRERDNLPKGDLDRTHRQQAVLDYVIWKLKTGGILTDLGQLTALLGTAKQYIMIDPGLNPLDFATQMHALSGQHLKFYTAPIVGYETIDGQDANQIDIPTIQAAIKAKFTAPAPSASRSAARAKPAKKSASVPAASTVTVDVYNGGTTSGLATDVSNALVARGYKAGLVTNSVAQSQSPAAGTEVFYGAGTPARAAKIANYFGVTATALPSLKVGHVEVLLGTGSTVVPAGLVQVAASAAASSGRATSAGNNGASGGAVTVAPNAKYGIPCEY